MPSNIDATNDTTAADKTSSAELSALLDTATAAPTTNDPPVIQLGLFWDEWARCIGSRYQVDRLYRVGRFDNCGRQWRDLKNATQARLLVFRDPHEARRLLDNTYYKKRTTISPTAGAIWELKETPGWD